ncbi:hypothetical protein [Bacillus solitudinis]|uniref:hypothetical protein n=1 Tax=Bacillus solitudinis TaxID=2014074 RepID=UPI0012FE7476|nr:hypothetical protein [Bacillus solitudinis]
MKREGNYIELLTSRNPEEAYIMLTSTIISEKSVPNETKMTILKKIVDSYQLLQEIE